MVFSSFAALVLKKETRLAVLSQASHLSGICWLLEARQAPFFSRRSECLVSAVPS